jgi:hypothetical protein
VRRAFRPAPVRDEQDARRREPLQPAPAAVLALQRTAGNAAVANLLQRVKWTWTDGEWVRQDGRPVRGNPTADFPEGTFEGQVYDDVAHTLSHESVKAKDRPSATRRRRRAVQEQLAEARKESRQHHRNEARSDNSPPAADPTAAFPGYDLVSGGAFEWQSLDERVRQDTATWAASSDLRVTIQRGGARFVIQPSAIHTWPVASTGNQLYGALTIVLQPPDGGDALQQETTQITKSYNPREEHTEDQLIDDLIQAMYLALQHEAVVGAVMEIRQTNTPCAGCQKKLAAAITMVRQFSGKPAIVRASALQLYESQPGELGRGLHGLAVRGADPEHAGPPDMSQVTGLHMVL